MRDKSLWFLVFTSIWSVLLLVFAGTWAVFRAMGDDGEHEQKYVDRIPPSSVDSPELSKVWVEGNTTYASKVLKVD